MRYSKLFTGIAAATGLFMSSGVQADDLSSCGLPESGDCNVANDNAGCADEACCLAVCEIDLFCCKEIWDQTCVDFAAEVCDGGGGGGNCGDPAAGACDVANGTPGCDDLECCTDVCAVDPYCCETAWDGICADESTTICYDGPTPENDECVDAIDLGTGDSVTAFSTLGANTSGPDLPAECESFGEVIIRGDIWYTWTASTDEIVVISTCNDADFDTRLALYSGDCEHLPNEGHFHWTVPIRLGPVPELTVLVVAPRPALAILEHSEAVLPASGNADHHQKGDKADRPSKLHKS